MYSSTDGWTKDVSFEKQNFINNKNGDSCMQYSAKTVVYFFSKKEQSEFWLLSNMAGGMEIFWKGLGFYSSVQLYQACKYLPDVECIPKSATEPVEPNVQKRILASKNPMAAKMTQKCAYKDGLMRRDWEEIKVECMLWVLELKLRWNPKTFGEVLKKTGDRTIVQKSSKDTFWGCKQINWSTLKAKTI
ncbi:MAG: NADAR family protein [Syntrophobacteraceae bacterium]